MINLKIIGYFNHYNTGDEQYKLSFTYIFDKYLNCEYTCEFLDCDKIYNKNFNDSDIIILGGGDVLNNYFLDKIHKKFQNTNNLILAVSVGLPYTDTLIKTNKLNIIDYIFIRTTVDLDIFKRYFFEDRIFYIPDLSLTLKYTLNNLNDNPEIDNPEKEDCIEKIKIQKEKDKKIVTINLSRHIYNKNYITDYNNIIETLRDFCNFLIKENYYIVFLPFNTSPINLNENDIIIQNDIKLLLNDINAVFIEKYLDIKEIFEIFRLSNLCIPMRFHACLFAIYTNTPIIPIYTTRKIKNLLKELDWEYKYEFVTNEKDIPIELNLDNLLYIYKNLQKNINLISKKLIDINENILDKSFNETKDTFINCLKYYKKKNINDKNNIDKLIDNTYTFIINYIKSKGYDNLQDITDLHFQQLIVNIISYKLTNGRINSEYIYGLQEKIFNTLNQYDYVTEWKWIINNELQKETTTFSNNNGLFNLKYIDQEDYSGCHRSGWQYVYKNLETFHNKDSPILLDLYVDRTFHWNFEINRLLNIIPYKNPWVGFVHHTFDETFSSYNCFTLLNCKEFIESLVYCKGIFVLSNYLKNLFDIEFKKLNLDINVYVLVHPTDLNVKSFSYKQFLENKNKMLIHIGGWLRNIYSFYNFELPKTTSVYSGFLLGDKTLKPYGYTNDTITKIALKGKNMNNYYPPSDLLLNLEFLLKNPIDQILLNEIDSFNQSRSINLNNQDIIDNIIRLHYLRQYGRYYYQIPNVSTNHANSRLQNREINFSNNQITPNCSTTFTSNCSFDNTIYNNWNKHFYNDIFNKINNMNFIEFLNNNEYDNLLSENIVYINLVDASAVNTIIECIVRATPIIVNKHPAAIELLGENYPLYFLSNHDDYNGINKEINKMLETDKLIRRAHNYLKRQSLNKFKIITFIKDFSKILKNITITL